MMENMVYFAVSLGCIFYALAFHFIFPEAVRAARQGNRIATANSRLLHKKRRPNALMAIWHALEHFMSVRETTDVGPYRFDWNPDTPVRRNRTTGTIVDMTA